MLFWYLLFRRKYGIILKTHRSLGAVIMKRLSVLIVLLLALPAVFGLTVYNHKTKQNENIEIIYADRASSINRVCELNSTYYYTSDKGVYSDDKCVLSTELLRLLGVRR